MKKPKVLLLLICLLFSGVCLGQDRIKKDTVYYLVDTGRTPTNDRLVSLIGKNVANTILEINCPCLKDGGKPRFAYNSQRTTPLSSEKLKTIKLITLRNLIDLAGNNDAATFFYNYVLYIIEPAGNQYVMHFASIARTKVFVIEDWITVPALGKG